MFFIIFLIFVFGCVMTGFGIGFATGNSEKLDPSVWDVRFRFTEHFLDNKALEIGVEKSQLKHHISRELSKTFYKFLS